MTSTAPVQINRTEIDGVPVYWADTPGRLEASLHFRVGVRDESFATTGLSHLIEHLAFSRLPAIKHDHNGQVELGLTTFTAAGRPDAIATTLAALCGSLAGIAAGDIDPAVLANEVKVLAAEGSLAVPPAIGEALTLRFGLAGLGLASAEPVFMERIRPDDVAEFASRYFTAGNAVLVLSGPPPEGLRLPLPDGGAVPWETTPVVPQVFPAEYLSGGDNLVLSFAIPGAGTPLVGASTVLGRVWGDRVRATLRRGQGLVYDVDIEYVSLGPETAVAIASFELKPANAVVVAREALTMLRDLRDNGVTPEELADALASLEEAGEDPQLAVWEANEEAMVRIGAGFGPPHEQLLAAARSVTNVDIARCFAELESSLLVGLPDGAVPEETGPEGVLYPPTQHRPADIGAGTEHRRGLLGAVVMKVPRDVRLTVADDGFRMFGEGESRAYRWSDIAGIAWDAPAEPGAEPDSCTVIGRDGFIVALVAGWFRRGDRALKEIAARVPSRVQYTAPAEDTATV